MSRDALVIGDGFQVEQQAFLRSIFVDVDASGREPSPAPME